MQRAVAGVVMTAVAVAWRAAVVMERAGWEATPVAAMEAGVAAVTVAATMEGQMAVAPVAVASAEAPEVGPLEAWMAAKGGSDLLPTLRTRRRSGGRQ